MPRLFNLSNYFLSARSKIFSYFSSKFLILKKGFTLVELSIVLLVLALLVSTLLVGRQIIDRAKVQQVVSEIDYYTKNFQMFRDQYDFLPGALGVENCKKYPEFSLQKGDDPTQYQSQCDDPTSQKTLLSESTAYTTYKQANFSMVDMVVSGMVENRSPGERRRKKFDIATVEEETCIEMPVIQGNYGLLPVDKAATRDIDNTMFGSGGFWYTETKSDGFYVHYQVGFEFKNQDGCYIDCCKDELLKTYDGKSGGGRCGIHYNHVCFLSYCNGSIVSGVNVSIFPNSQGPGTNAIYGKLGDIYFKLTDIAKAKYKNDKNKFCETRTIPGEPRLGYLLKQDEIENQANKSSFDSKTWISYSGGKVDRTMIYGFGDTTLAGAGDASAIVFFHFDADKNELTDDGAVSYALYDLIVKKLGEKTDGSSIGNIIPYSKSSGQGFNFGYIMR